MADPPADVSVRQLRYFVAVAEHEHLTRAAETLHVAQPALSKAIRRLEHELGLALFVRNRAGTTLTDAGRALLPNARTALTALDQGLRDARDATRRGGHVLRIDYHSSIGSALLTPISTEFSRRRPGWQIELRLGDWSDPAGAVLGGHCDAALLRLPIPGQEHLDTVTLRRDRRWVALPADHRLADHDVVTLADLAHEPFIALPAASEPHRSDWLGLGHHKDRRTIAVEVANADDWFEAISAGQGVAMLSETSTRIHQRPGIVYRLVEDAPPSELVLAWNTQNTNPVLRDIVAAALDTV